ncbi:zinc-dependent metalloprotease [Pedobacter sp. MC2016-24]|uniref:zinc-dependent metalloprotease n=1 Tax=Pedobacter sp. MC2016-24 TaxID=2780090 RepID=UPI00187F9513|nr:zinc-dependent metalloprotease [Pedobacter sp. MC2016-24]MBE9602436.1 zinc-dependent metalloprotease [Pedobacter sp. MC2016-24]
MFKQKSLLFYCALSLGTFVSGCAIFHKKKVPAPKVVAVDPAKKTADSLKKATALKPYAEIITKTTKTQKGFITVHQKENKYYFEIPNAILNREILFVNRVSKASADMRNGANGYAGDQIGETVYRFEKGRDKKIFLRRISFSEYSKDSTTTMFAGVRKNNIQAIAAVFPMLALTKDSSATVVEVTDFLNSDNDILYFERKVFKDRAGMGAQQNDKSYIDYVHAYPKNVEIRAVKTYSAGLNPSSSSYTIELNSSMVLLDENPMKPRLQDSRIGYFSTSFRDFDADPQGVKTTTYVSRWKLEPKPEDVEKYKRGELVEPAKQIVFYIDPVTPKKWVPYLIQGVNDWQKAFEAAGFKNAIVAKEAPTREQDSTWSIDDARHSAIIYRPSAVANAMGPSTVDPRSGEIIESHIFWYHNVMSVLQRWYMMQTGAVDPRGRKATFDDELMGNLIRFVSSHEVGHTLGLMHNFGSSSTVPVEKLRDKAWVEAHGHTPSIMDYARFNYVAQPEDNISEKGLFPRIGDYDKWAIKWAYTWHPEFASPQDEQKVLVKMATDSIRSNKRLWFGNEMEPFDPRSQNEDLGDDAVKASTYGIKNLKRIIPQVGQWLTVPDADQSKLQAGYVGVWEQYQLYLGHVIKNIGGIYHTVKVNGEPGPIYEPVGYDKQKRAVKFVNDELFNTPMWLNNKDLAQKLDLNFDAELNNLQKGAINALVMRNRIMKLWGNEHNGSGVKTYTISDLFNDLNAGILREAHNGTNVDYYRRNLQKVYVYRLLEQTFIPNEMNTSFGLSTYKFTATDLKGLFKAELRKQRELFVKAAKKPGLNALTKAHFNEMVAMIDSKFTADKNGLIN